LRLPLVPLADEYHSTVIAAAQKAGINL